MKVSSREMQKFRGRAQPRKFLPAKVSSCKVHKIEKYKTPSYLRNKLPPHRRPLYRLNNSNTFQEIRCKTARYRNSFFPDATSSWNNLISNFQDIPTFTSLKSHLLSLIRPKIISTFGIHDALGLRYLFQLRVNLSPLRSHKMDHNFSHTPSETCECNLGIEDIRHFLFECPAFMEFRKWPQQLTSLIFCKGKTWAI